MIKASSPNRHDWFICVIRLLIHQCVWWRGISHVLLLCIITHDPIRSSIDNKCARLFALSVHHLCTYLVSTLILKCRMTILESLNSRFQTNSYKLNVSMNNTLFVHTFNPRKENLLGDCEEYWRKDVEGVGYLGEEEEGHACWLREGCCSGHIEQSQSWTNCCKEHSPNNSNTNIC